MKFFDTRRSLTDMNKTITTLTPKNSHAESVGDFRPISCCNVIYPKFCVTD